MGSVGLPDFDVLDSFHNVIDGKLSSTSKTRHSINPATEKPNPEVPVSTAEDVDAAVAAGEAAFPAWRDTPYEKRRQLMLAFADEIDKYAADFAKLLTQEQGKPTFMAQSELQTTTHFIRGLCDVKFEEEITEDSDERQIITRYAPLGLAVGIVPWNFPVHLACAKIAPALLTGNTIIIKPSPFTPYGGLKLAELGQKVFPPGVLQALSGGDDLGPMFTAHPGPQKISFTGSTVTGKKVMESASKTLKRVTLELGGNDPCIVCKDVDVETVAPKITTLAFLNSGQICIAIKRIYVHEEIFDKFKDAMVKHAKTLKVGAGTEEGVFLGPINNSMQFEKVKDMFSEIEKQKWNVAFGGKNEDTTGYFINPTIIDRPADDSRIVVEEPFGPIVPLLSWSDEKDVIARANNTRSGLGGSVWGNDLTQTTRIARQIESGNVWVNTHMELDPKAAFGGHKESGIGSEMGLGGLRSYCNVQSLCIRKKA